jgi:signal transduction histidine kinase
MRAKRTTAVEEPVKIDIRNFMLLGQNAPVIYSNQNVIDITSLKRLEEKYIDTSNQLNKALEAKNDFLNNMSHEIRIPLHSIMNVSKEVYEQWDTMPDDEKKDWIKNLVDSQDRLMSLVGNLLDLCQIKDGKLDFNFTKNDVIAVLKEAIDEFKYITDPISLSVEDKCSIIAHFDILRIKQVVRNLISNAVKHGSKNKPIHVRVAAEDSKHINISVADQGIGVPTAEATIIFEPFEESSLTKSRAGGRGLGLAICRNIILAHRGKIWVEQNKESGSIFIFTLPLERP